jgi:hypothetical protein
MSMALYYTIMGSSIGEEFVSCVTYTIMRIHAITQCSSDGNRVMGNKADDCAIFLHTTKKSGMGFQELARFSPSSGAWETKERQKSFVRLGCFNYMSRICINIHKVLNPADAVFRSIPVIRA